MMALTSCIEEQPEIVVPTPGEGVKFYASLNNIETKTIYGDEVYGNGADKPATAIKVNWVDGDMISVYGTTCLPDRNQGQYKVTSEINDDNYSYASNLEMVGDHGVQWGTGEDSKTSDFYAVYPSVAEGAFSKNTDGNIVVSTSIRSEQKNVFVEETTQDNSGNEVTIWSGTPYIDVTNNNVTTKTRTMPDALMYSYTPKVSSGSVVNLNFKPFATVLKFSIDGWSSTGELKDPTVYVQKIILTAPSNVALAGDCTFTFNSNGIPTAKAGSSTSNVITIAPVLDGADFLPLKRNDKVEFNVFVIPQANNQNTNNMILNENWNVRLETTHGNFTFKLNPTVPEGKKAELIAGEIHKINIPQLVVQSQFTYETENWIEAIPRNVYLSELSVPGAWYCTESGYQDNTDLTAQYDAGIRAFHFDCRLSNSEKIDYDGSDDTKLRLVCSGTDKITGGFIGIGTTYEPGTLVSDKIDIIANLAKSKPREYVVIVLTIAEQAFKYTGFGGGTFGTINPQKVLPYIRSMLEENGTKWNVYGYTADTKGKSINADTMVSEALGKMIVLVNTNTTAFTGYESSSVPNTLTAFASMALQEDEANGVMSGDFTQMLQSNMYWGNEITSPLLTMHYHFAQKTGSSTTSASPSYDGTPTLKTRMNTIDEIVIQSDGLYYPSDGTQSAHNEWYQIGIGGYIKTGNSTEHGTVASTLNEYLYHWIEDKLKGGSRTITQTDGTNKVVTLRPSPVGIVLMNKCTNEDYYGPQLVQSIIDMNGKFWLNRDETKPEWPE